MKNVEPTSKYEGPGSAEWSARLGRPDWGLCLFCHKHVPARAATKDEVFQFCGGACRDYYERTGHVCYHQVSLCPTHGNYMEQHGDWIYIGKEQL